KTIQRERQIRSFVPVFPIAFEQNHFDMAENPRRSSSHGRKTNNGIGTSARSVRHSPTSTRSHSPTPLHQHRPVYKKEQREMDRAYESARKAIREWIAGQANDKVIDLRTIVKAI